MSFLCQTARQRALTGRIWHRKIVPFYNLFVLEMTTMSVLPTNSICLTWMCKTKPMGQVQNEMSRRVPKFRISSCMEGAKLAAAKHEFTMVDALSKSAHNL